MTDKDFKQDFKILNKDIIYHNNVNVFTCMYVHRF